MSETWVINEKPELIQEPAIYFDVNMKTNMRDETGQIIEILASIIEFKDYTTISTENFPILEIDTTDEENPEYIWCSEEPLLIRTWEFLEPPTGDLLTWLQANAVKQENTTSKPKLLMSTGSGGNSSETWVMNNYIGSIAPNDVFNSNSCNINFVSNGNEYSLFDPRTADISTNLLSYDNIAVYSYSKKNSTGWIDDAYRTVTFETAPTGDLLTWLQANATKQSSASKPCFAFFNSKFIISSSTSIPNSSLGVLTNNGAMMNDGKIVVKGSGDGWETKVIPTIVS